MQTLTVNKNRIGPILGRHPWVFSGALKHIPDGIPSGEPVVLVDEQGNFLASGYFNSYSQIAVRLWSWNKDETVDEVFFEKRIREAYELRKQYVESKETNAFRLVYGENDFLPGFIADKYADYICVQFHNQGIEHWSKEIVAALVKVLKPNGIYERSDVRDRKRFTSTTPVILSGVNAPEESLSPKDKNVKGILQGGSLQDDNVKSGQLLHGEVPDEIKIKENGFTFLVDVKGGQKTGFFLDQRDKRQALMKYVEGKKVLNCFSYTGGFSVYALGADAEHVVSVDASEPALEMAEKNVQANKLPEKKAEYILADVKEYLGDLLEAQRTATLPNPPLEREGGQKSPPFQGGVGVVAEAPFDVIILDPPAFVKDRHKVKEGLQGYRKINQQALAILPPGGILLTCSCSAHVSLTDFRFMLTEAAARAGRQVQIIETYTHGIDHPELTAFTEGEYLKCIFARVL